MNIICFIVSVVLGLYFIYRDHKTGLDTGYRIVSILHISVSLLNMMLGLHWAFTTAITIGMLGLYYMEYRAEGEEDWD